MVSCKSSVALDELHRFLVGLREKVWHRLDCQAVGAFVALLLESDDLALAAAELHVLAPGAALQLTASLASRAAAYEARPDRSAASRRGCAVDRSHGAGLTRNPRWQGNAVLWCEL